jgi:hypothetical protein
MASFTIHDLDATLDRRLAERSRMQGISKNQLIKDLLAQATGLPVAGKLATDYSEFCGLWSAADLAEFAQSSLENERVDPEDWK